MNDDMPWVDLTLEEIQQLRTNKQELTEYGKRFHECGMIGNLWEARK